MDERLKGRVAVVTGASKGIGAGIAKALGLAGANVVVNYASDKDGADRVVKEIGSLGGTAIVIQADVANAKDVERLFREADSRFGRLDILVNNAAVFKFDLLAEVTADEFHREFNTNVLGMIQCTREALKYFKAAKGGRVINISSIGSTDPVPGSTIYAATKGAIDTMSVVWARELAEKNILVNTIAPGATETEGARAIHFSGSEREKMIIAKTPLKRIGLPEDIGRVAVFLASDESAWVTGVRIAASGGL